MVGGTRSRSILKDADTSSNSAGGKGKDMSGSSTYATALSDLPNLRRSSRETPAKKARTLSPSPQKSEKLDKKTPSSSSDKKKSERAEKKSSRSPLRRSGRLEKNGFSSSSGSIKVSNSSSSQGKKSKVKVEKNGTLKDAVTSEQGKDNKADIKSVNVSQKRKRLDFHSYRSFLRPQANIRKTPEVGKKLEEVRRTLQDDAVDSGVNDPKEIHDGGDDCHWRDWREVHENRHCEDLVEGSSCGSRELSPLGDDEHSKKHKICSPEANESKDESDSSNSKCSDRSSQSSPVAVTGKDNHGTATAGGIDGEADSIVAYKLGRKELRAAELVESTSEETSPAVYSASRIGNTSNIVNPAIKDGCKPVGKLEAPCTSVAVARCPQEDEEELKPESKEKLAGTKSEDCSKGSSHTIAPIEEDRGKLTVTDITGSAEEHLSFEESLCEIERDMGTNACGICKKPGMLLCCDGKDCKRSYHLACLDPHLKDIPVGVWLCPYCVKKKMESGVYSVSQGIESVFDSKEGMQSENHYLVKYKGLSHVHNRWIPESQILIEAPTLLAKFNRRRHKEKVVWKQEWTEPHRLLQKRLMMPRKLADKYFSGLPDNDSICHHEWLVKWKGLGYDHTSWESECAPVLRSPEAMSLIRNYESRLEEAKSRPSRADKVVQQVKKGPFHKLLTLPDGFPPGFDNDHLNSINRLLEFWHRSQNAVFIDEQERIIKSILFILALQSHACQPFLIMSTPSSLSVWESELSRLAPTVNLVIYSGNRDARKVIRNVEFSEGGCIMFQVLLSQPDSIVEDFEDIKCIDWEMIVIDECQNLRISKHFEKLKHLSSDFKLILLSGQLKDTVAEHLNLLSFLYSGEKENCVNILKFDSKDTVGALAILKEKIAHYLAYERKPDSLKFDEYWVPVRLSNVQLEQYCSMLLSNSISLRSSSKIDPVGALRDIVISTRKCCDHPYIVNPSLQSELTKNSPPADYLDIGVNASGKLLLLDKILQEIKNQGLRVLILFQSIGGAGRNSIGDILDDFLRQRFGADSYERVDCGLLTSKKLAALNMFNDKAKRRFIFLIENRACLPSIKLSSVDAAIIFDSDWNPLNDLRALQKISIESQFEQVIVFRLYSSCTVEEKVLIFAKQDMILESNIRNINRSVSHSLLTWGASYLFSKLDEFHQHDKPSNCSEASTDKAFLNDVMSEVLTHLPNKAEGCDTGNCSILIKAQHSGASYSRNIVLVGEKEGISSLEKDPSSFWSDILDGRYPKWRYIPPSSQRIRRKVQSSDELAKVPEVKNDEGKIKRRKIAGVTLNQNYPISLQTLVEEKNKQAAICKDSMVPDNLPPSCGSGQSSPASPKKMLINASCLSKEIEASPNQDNFGSESMPHSPYIVNHFIHNQLGPPMSDCTPGLPKPHMVEYDWTEKLRNTQMNLHLLLKPDLSKMCDTLKLPDDVKNLADALLEYLMNNHLVSREPETILQAFILSLCWRAASWLKHTVGRKESIALAKKYLNYECEEDQVYSVYSKLRMLKNKFSHWRGALKDDSEVTSAENKSWASSIEDAPKEPLSCPTPISSESYQLVSEGDKTRDRDDVPRCIHNPTEGEHANVIETPAKILENSGSLQEVLLNKRIELIEKLCLRRQEELNLKQQVELSNFNVLREEEKMKLRKAYDTELEVTQSINPDSTVSIYKIRLLNQEFRRKMAAFDQHMRSQRRKLGLMQSDARNKEQQIKACWLEEAKAGRLVEFFDDFPLSDTGFILERFIVNEKACGDMENAKLACGPSNHPCQDDNASGQVESIESILGLSEIPLVIPDVMVNNISLGSEPSPSECSNMSAMDSFETIEMSTEIPTTISGVACKMPVETQYPATHVPEGAGDMPNEEAEDNALEAETAGDMPNGEVGEIVVETETPVSHCQNVNEVVPTEPTETSGEDPEAVLPGIGGDLPLEIVSSPFKSAPTGFLGENSMPTNQERTASSEEGPSYQAVVPHTGLSTQQAIVGSPVQVGQSDQVLLHCDVNPLPFSATTSGGTFLEDAQCHTDGNEVLLQQPVLDTTLLVEHGNQVAPQDFHPSSTPGTASSVDLSSTYYQTTQQEGPMEPPIISPAPQVDQSDQFISPAVVPAHETHSSTCQSEFSVQQSIAEAGLQIDQSNQLILQSSVHLLPPSIITPPERTQSEDISHTVQPDSESRFLQNMATANWMPPQGLHHDPLQNELIKIRRQTDLCVKMQEDKKQRLKFECDLEIEMVRGKYDALLQEAETEFLRDKEILDTIYNKVSMNRVLAEQFRARFIENTGGSLSSSQGPRSSYMQQLIHASQPQLAQRTASTSILPSTSFPMPVTLPPVVASATAALSTPSRLWTPVSTAASPIASSAQVPGAHNASIPFSTRTPLRPVLLPRANLQSRSEPRAPAPHLHRFRPPVSMSAQNLLLQVGGLTPASAPSPVTPVPPSLLPLSRGPSPVAPVLPSPMPPLYRGPSFPPVHLGNDMTNLTTEGVQSFDEWFSSNIDLPGIEVPASSSDATKPIAVSDVVCISDDE